MAFTDIIDNYANGSSGSLSTINGNSVGYTVTSNADTISRPGIDRGAKVTADGQKTVTVTFDQTVQGASFSMGASTPGEIYFVKVDGVTINLNDAIANGIAVFTQTGPETHFITAAGGLTSSGPTFNGSVGFVRFTSPVNSIEIFGTGGNSGNFDAFDIGIDSEDFFIVCFSSETDIAVPNGTKRVSEISEGDLVTTVDGSQAKIVGISKRQIKPLQLALETRLLPVLIKVSALGHGLPIRDLRVSRQHRVLIASRIAARLCNKTEILVPAHTLVGLPGVDFDHSMQTVDFYHVLLENHDILLANGAPSESLFIGSEADLALNDEPAAISPKWRRENRADQMQPARLLVDGKLARKVVDAHRKHGRPVLEEWAPITGQRGASNTRDHALI